MNGLASSTYRLLPLILHPLKNEFSVVVKRFAFEIGQLVRITIQDPPLANGSHKEACKSTAQANILRAVKVAPCFLRTLFFLSLSPLFLILLVEVKEFGSRDQLQVERTTSRDDR